MPTDSLFPHKAYSLADFILQAKRLDAQENSKTAFAKFVLCGIHDDHQAVIDPLRDVVGEHHSITSRRDYDSLIGVSPHLLVTDVIYVSPVSKFSDVLQSNVHITQTIRGRPVPLHKIPNIMFAKWNERNMIRVFFPRLYLPHGNGRLTEEQLADFYEKGLRPAIEELDSFGLADWPATYRDEMFRARKANGQLAFQTKEIPIWNVTELGTKIREQLQAENVDWSEDFFFGYQVRGTKASTTHSMTLTAATTAINEFIENLGLSEELMDPMSWWIDVGLEFHSEDGDCLQWRTDAHVHVVKRITGIDDSNAQRITSIGSSKYSRDLAAHLPAISGCRIEPGERAAGRFEACYIQLYTTDKSLTYQLDGWTHAKTMSCSMALDNDQPSKFMESLYQLYLRASNGVASNARLEMRVPLVHADAVLLDFDNLLLRRSIVTFAPVVWWSLKCYRLKAAGEVMSTFAASPGEARGRMSALVLIIALVWIVNGLHARPDDGRSARQVMGAALPLVSISEFDANTVACRARVPGDPSDARPTYAEEDEEEDDTDTYPHNPFGIVFLRPFFMPPQKRSPRFCIPRFIDEAAVEFYLGKSLADIRDELNPVGIRPPSYRDPNRVVTNKTRRTPRVVHWDDEAPPVLFNVEAIGHRLPTPNAHSDEEDAAPQETTSLDVRITTIFRQFMMDVAMRSPVPGGGRESYCKLSEHDRLLVNESFFTNNNLSDHWRAISWRIVDAKRWTTSFDHLWPTKGRILTGRTQGYAQCTYYRDWKALVSTLPEATVEHLRLEMKQKLLEFAWIPNAKSDRLWDTGAKEAGFRRLPQNTTGPAPQVLFLVTRPQVQWDNVPVN